MREVDSLWRENSINLFLLSNLMHPYVQPLLHHMSLRLNTNKERNNNKEI
jgi:hypothetical protein